MGKKEAVPDLVKSSEAGKRYADETVFLDAIATRAVEIQQRRHAMERDRHREFTRLLVNSIPDAAEKLRRLSRPAMPKLGDVAGVLKDEAVEHQLGLLHTLGGPALRALSVKGAPYDFEWTARRDFGDPRADRMTGQMTLEVSSGSIPFDSNAETTWNGAAIGLRFVPQEGNPLIRVGSYLRFVYKWFNDSTLEVARNRGEVGVLVRKGGNGPIIQDRRFPLWNDGTSWYQTHSDEQFGVFNDSVFFLAAPGEELSIWFWFNSSIDFDRGPAFSSRASNTLDARLVFVVIEQ